MVSGLVYEIAVVVHPDHGKGEELCQLPGVWGHEQQHMVSISSVLMVWNRCSPTAKVAKCCCENAQHLSFWVQAQYVQAHGLMYHSWACADAEHGERGVLTDV